MVFYFPDFDTLQLAITSAAVPPAVSQARVVAGFDDKGPIWLQPSVAIERAGQMNLRRLGVQVAKTIPCELVAQLSCWLQVLPIKGDGAAPVLSVSAPVLFELSAAEQLPGLVGEMLRLGNDRQSFRYLKQDADSSVLLRVIGPPYYSLLRALDHLPEKGTAPRAYLERAPRVWVEIGHTHPLVEQIRPPEGKVLLLRPPRVWVLLEDAPFRDIYEILEFALPNEAVPWREADWKSRLTVPLRLIRSGAEEAAELWILPQGAFNRLDELVRTAGDELIGRLSFAVGEASGEKIIALRVRPSRQAPPVLVFPEALQFRSSHLKLPNLFLPCGMRLQPPLRRDALRQLLADNPDHITWLSWQADGTFTPQSLPDTAFRPLTDWVDYILDHEHVALQAWVQSTRFDFESFICPDDQPAKPKKPPSREPRSDPRRGRRGVDQAQDEATPFVVVNKSRQQKAAEELGALPALPAFKPSELQQQLQALEKTFLDLQTPLEAPERQELWPRLAQLNAALDRASDATVCWLNSLWEDHPHVPGWARAWAQTVTRSASGELTATELDRLLAANEPTLAHLRTLMACLVWTAHQPQPSALVMKRLDRIQQFLLAHEALLPVRGVWLAWHSLFKLSRDVLALARTRDRLLERLFKNGLTVEQDLPGFLRFSAGVANERARLFHDWFLKLPQRISQWLHRINRPGLGANPADTEGYAYLILAYGLARLGESQEARKLLARAKERLGERDEVHSVLLEVFDYRIGQALEGKPLSGPLPPEQIEYIEHMERLIRYRVDRLRQHSRILEPHESNDPYRRWYSDDISKELAAWPDITDRRKLEERIQTQLKKLAAKKEATRQRAQVLTSALALAPRIGESFAVTLLPQVPGACDELVRLRKEGKDLMPVDLEKTVEEQAALLEKSLFLAAHFDQGKQVQELVDRFQELLHSQRGSPVLPKLNPLAGQCFRGLRKLGMRDQIDYLLRQMAEVVLEGQELQALRQRAETTMRGKEPEASEGRSKWATLLQTLLHVASGWYYFGKDDQARPVMDAVRSLLFNGNMERWEQTRLACAYAATLGQAPAELTLRGIEELFQKLERVRDDLLPNSHYSLSQLDVIEAVVLAVVTDDFAMGTQGRRWLDDDEYLVRRRIHRDVHAVMRQDVSV
jgi:hypothetical protein